MVLGAFAEAGFGSYDSFNSFSQASNITANGSTRYYGAGMLGHQEFANGMYIDGSLRAGRVESSYRSTDLENALGHSTSFDSNRTYYSAHMGLGKTLKVSQQGSLDMYTSCFTPAKMQTTSPFLATPSRLMPLPAAAPDWACVTATKQATPCKSMQGWHLSGNLTAKPKAVCMVCKWMPPA